ncbi:hypothetical protein KDC22_33070 [Paenibacillus tritici]|uniref:hypothetical protein n=1 Tax=Paenibacillus tritici TaxID=1873425 RepID=UPI001BA5CA0B|nr:hypothetical protein [Paenibacillus tritici]QUL55011.1 hypothetical protein KDC22_33070 [Paenibacillus tritici]
MMMRIVKRALGICLIVVLASGLSMLTTAYVVNTYIQSVLASLDIKLDGPGPGIGGFVKGLTGMGGGSGANPKDEISKETSKETTTETDSGKTDGEQGNSGGKTGNTENQSVDEKVPENALPVMGQAAAGEEQSESALDQNLVMTPEAMNDLKENLPANEKSNIFNILMTKLPQEEMIKISAALEGGLTESEVTELQGIIEKYVDADEYKALMKMLTPDNAEPNQN